VKQPGARHISLRPSQIRREAFYCYDYEFADLDRNGVYELIAWNRRPFDIRCGFAIADVRFYPEVFVPSGSGYQRAWPPPDCRQPMEVWRVAFKDHEKEGVPWDANIQIVAGFADLDSDGTAELIVLQDRFREEPAQSLAIYKLNKTAFVPVAQVLLPAQHIAFLLEGFRQRDPGADGDARQMYQWRRLYRLRRLPGRIHAARR